jgi:transcriptional regulator with XRE-family HTH domain
VAGEASAQRLRIGVELRRLRAAAGLSGEEAASALGWSQPKVSRIEAGRTAFTLRDVSRLLALYGVADDVRAELLAATSEDVGEGAWVVRAGGFPRRQGAIASLEAGTKLIRQYQPLLVPGLLQTSEYALAVARAVGVMDPEEVVRSRLNRQAAVFRKGGPRYEVVVEGTALLVRVGSPAVMRRQLLALADQATRPGLVLRVVRLGTEHRVLSTSPFTIFEFRAPESPRVAWMEMPTGDVYFSDAADVEQYDVVFDGLRRFALSRDASAAYLKELAEEPEQVVDRVGR